MALVSAEGCLMNVLLCHAYLVEALAQIQFGKARSNTKLVKELVNGGLGKPMFDGDSIESPIIDATPLATILFFNQKYRQGERVVAEPDETKVKHRSDLFFELCLLAVRISIWLYGGGVGIG